jgi:hypothetical protein
MDNIGQQWKYYCNQISEIARLFSKSVGANDEIAEAVQRF